jgi:hypothetical protein
MSYTKLSDDFVELEVPIPNTMLTASQQQDIFAPLAANIPFLLCRQIMRDLSEALHQRAIGIRGESNGEQTIVKIVLPLCKTLKSSS